MHPERPRAFSDARNWSQNPKDSLSPTAVPSTSWCRRWETPVATTKAWETTCAPTRTLQNVASQNTRELGMGQAAGAE